VNLDDDTVWLDALAGRIDAVPSPGVVREAVALRELIRSQEFNVSPAVPMVDAEREAALIERARREGLLSPRAPPRRWFAVKRLGFAAAAMIIIAIGAGFWRSFLPPAETLRGVDHGTVRLAARDPQALKRQLTEELQSAGVKVSGYERLDRIGIDADLPQPVSSQLAEVLKQHHIPIPADGVLVVEIEAAGRP
jgi:hypothetical protein